MTLRSPWAAEADAPLCRRETATVTYLEPTVLRAHPGVRCAFTTRHAGRTGRALNLGFAQGVHADVAANRQAVLAACMPGQRTLCTVRQVHGNHVCVIDDAMLQRDYAQLAADALITSLPDVALGILMADCLPIVLYSPRTPVVALVHAGRMGTYHRIVQQVLTALATRFATPPAQLHAVLGPAIGACCYTLDWRAIAPFQERFPTWETFCMARGTERWTMSLTAANTEQLCAAGVPNAQIHLASPCTSCHTSDFYSHRAEGLHAGRMMALVALQ